MRQVLSTPGLPRVTLLGFLAAPQKHGRESPLPVLRQVRGVQVCEGVCRGVSGCVVVQVYVGVCGGVWGGVKVCRCLLVCRCAQV